MDYLQYLGIAYEKGGAKSFKPYYKWITFNTTYVVPYYISDREF